MLFISYVKMCQANQKSMIKMLEIDVYSGIC